MCEVYTGVGKSRFTVLNTQTTAFILILSFINYCINFHMNCKPTLPSPVCVYIYVNHIHRYKYFIMIQSIVLNVVGKTDLM